MIIMTTMGTTMTMGSLMMMKVNETIRGGLPVLAAEMFAILDSGEVNLTPCFLEISSKLWVVYMTNFIDLRILFYPEVPTCLALVYGRPGPSIEVFLCFIK